MVSDCARVPELALVDPLFHGGVPHHERAARLEAVSECWNSVGRLRSGSERQIVSQGESNVHPA